MSALTLNLTQGSVTFNFSASAAAEMQQAIAELMTHLKAAATPPPAGQRPQPRPSMEYRHTGEVFLELFCNPNIWPSPFAAKVLITVRDDRLRLTTEADLTRVIEDLNTYLEQA